MRYFDDWLVVVGKPMNWQERKDVYHRAGQAHVLCVNDAWRAWELLPTAWFSLDQVALRAAWRSPLFERAMEPAGLLYTVDLDQKLYLERERFADILPALEDPGLWGRHPGQGLRIGNCGARNSGLPAINLADALGAERIFLAGFRLTGTYERFLPGYEDALPLCRAELINLTPTGSQLPIVGSS